MRDPMSNPFSKRKYQPHRKSMFVSKETYNRTPPDIRRKLNMKILEVEKAK